MATLFIHSCTPQEISLKAIQKWNWDILVSLLHFLPSTLHDWERSGSSSQMEEKTDNVHCDPGEHFSHRSMDLGVLCTVCHFLIRYHSSVFSSGSCVQELQRSSFIIFHSCQIHYMWLTETWKYFIFHRWSCWEQVVGTPMESITVLQLTALEKELKPKLSASDNRTLHI